MTSTNWEKILGYVYFMFGVVFVISLVLLTLMKDANPFGIQASRAGGSLILMRTDTNAAVGDRLARPSGTGGEMAVWSITETYRKDGELYYRMMPVGKSGEEVVKARTVFHEVISIIPALGVLAYMLAYPLGAFALVGIPFLTFMFDMLFKMIPNRFMRGIEASVRRIIARRRATRTRYVSATDYHQKDVGGDVMYDDAQDDDVVPIARGGTYTTKREDVSQHVGMTIHVARPRHYGV